MMPTINNPLIVVECGFINYNLRVILRVFVIYRRFCDDAIARQNLYIMYASCRKGAPTSPPESDEPEISGRQGSLLRAFYTHHILFEGLLNLGGKSLCIKNPS